MVPLPFLKKLADTFMPKIVESEIVYPNALSVTTKRRSHRSRIVGEYEL
jgi:hypothetical protein